MDVPFVSSGASSRAHYVLVRKVEEETSFIRADQHLAEAVDVTLRDLMNSQLSIKKSKEHFIMLLYCYSTASAGALNRNALHDVLSHAITLAEAGKTVAEKRIGYLFCSEMMLPGHEFQLMLVNTLRKDLESSHVPRICLALNHLISSPSQEVIPAIQTRLLDLLAHNSPVIRRRALLALKSLSHYNPDLLTAIVALVSRRLRDTDQSVSNAALSVATRTFELHDSTRLDVNRVVNELLGSTFSPKTYMDRRRLGGGDLRVLNAANLVGVSENNLPLIGDIIRFAAKRKKDALLREAFLTLRSLGPETSLLKSGKLSPISHVRHLLTSQDVNDQYLFLSCLESVDPNFWAGTTLDIPPVLDQWEVEHIMRLLDSKDSLVRKTTVRILNKVDGSVVGSYYTRSLQQMPPGLSLAQKAEYVCRLLEILEIESQGDGEQYAREVQEVLQHVNSVTIEDKEAFLETVVENVLSRTRIASADWQIQCATTFLARFLELEQASDPTTTVILAALACEYIDRVSVSPYELLKKMASQLISASLRIQEACLLAMLRVAAECDHIPEDVLNMVSKVGEAGSRRIRFFSLKFRELIRDRSSLNSIVCGAKSSAKLPDFLRSLQSNTKPESHNHSQGSPSISQKSDRLSTSKLRYTAYESPMTTPQPKSRSLSQGSERESRIRSPNLAAGLKALTGGDLTIATPSEEFELTMMKPGPPRLHMSTTANTTESEQGSKKDDLIALDSPFVDPRVEGDADVENLWSSFDPPNTCRGWYDGTIDQVVKLVAALSTVRISVVDALVPPYEGELKVLVFSAGQAGELQSFNLGAILRLKSSEEETCLWRLRGKQPIYEKVKDLLTHE